LLQEGATEFGFTPTLVEHEPFPKGRVGRRLRRVPARGVRKSINLRTGDLAVDAQVNAGVVAVSSHGWTASVERGNGALRAVDSSSPRVPEAQHVVQFLSQRPQVPGTLDEGPVAPRSLRIAGSAVEWTSTTGRHGVALH
jgi:hypothetical protein